MQSFPVLTIDTAPAKSKPALQALQNAFGMIPNVAGTMATSPVLIDSLVALFRKVHGGSFTEAQIQTNITGVYLAFTVLAEKRLELVREMVPNRCLPLTSRAAQE
jgi:hypothetical protein